MREICIPIPHFGDNQIAEVEVTVNGKKRQYNFRVESFAWSTGNVNDKPVDSSMETQVKIQNLRKLLDEYDDSWEIVQIFTPHEGSDHIQVLFRQRTLQPA